MESILKVNKNIIRKQHKELDATMQSINKLVTASNEPMSTYTYSADEQNLPYYCAYSTKAKDLGQT
jgi:hypothetical protein